MREPEDRIAIIEGQKRFAVTGRSGKQTDSGIVVQLLQTLTHLAHVLTLKDVLHIQLLGEGVKSHSPISLCLHLVLASVFLFRDLLIADVLTFTLTVVMLVQ